MPDVEITPEGFEKYQLFEVQLSQKGVAAKLVRLNAQSIPVG